MFTNAGLISLIYPLLVFGYALLEETRPRYKFWSIVRWYTVAVLFLKFIVTLKADGGVLVTNKHVTTSWEKLDGYIKLGLYDYTSLISIAFYMLPEILILACLIDNEIRLRMLGLFYNTE